MPPHDAPDPIQTLVGHLDHRASASHEQGWRYIHGIIFLLFFTVVALVFSPKVARIDYGAAGPAPSDATRPLVDLEDVESCGSTLVVAGQRGVIGISQNRGVDWQNVEGLPEAALYDLSFSADCSHVVAVGNNGTIAYSTNSGESWTVANKITQHDIKAVALSKDGSTAIAAGDDGLLIASTDQVRTWHKIQGLGAQDARDVALTRDGEKAVVVGRDNLARVLERDAGTFTVSEPKVEHEARIYFHAAVLSEHRSDSNALHPEVPLQAFALGEHGAIFKSEGSVWTEVNEFMEGTESIEDAVFHRSMFLAVGRDGTSWMSDDGENWLTGASGQGNELNSVAVNERGTVAVAVGADGTVLGLTKSRLEEAIRQRQATGDTGDWTMPWKLHTVGTASVLNGVTFVAGDTFAVVGENALILLIDIPESESRPVKYRTVDEVGFLDDPDDKDRPRADADEATSDEAHAEFWWADQTFLTLLQNNILRIGAITLFIFIATHVFGLARYQFRLGAYYRARADALRQVDGQWFDGHLRDIGQLNEFMLALSPDHLETSFSSTERAVASPINRFFQIGSDVPQGQRLPSKIP